jgi:putative hydrolase of the HAD superfamily
MQATSNIESNGVEAIIFDLDGTLRHSDPVGKVQFYKLAGEMGVPVFPENQRAADRWVHSYWAQSRELEEDRVTSDGQENGTFWRLHAVRHLRALGADESRLAELATEITSRMLHEYSPVDRVPEDVVPTLRKLRNYGFQLGLLSNRHEALDEVAGELGLDEHFDFKLAAGEIGWWKPDPRIFHHGLGLIQVEAKASVYVGDNYYADILGARSAGLRPILIDPEKVFPDADCEVIETISDLLDILAA